MVATNAPIVFSPAGRARSVCLLTGSAVRQHFCREFKMQDIDSLTKTICSIAGFTCSWLPCEKCLAGFCLGIGVPRHSVNIVSWYGI